MRKVLYDYSTLNMAALRCLPEVVVPVSCYLQEQPGNDCYLDPPGYPSYFTQQILGFDGEPVSDDLVIVLPDQTVRSMGQPNFGHLRQYYSPVSMDDIRFTFWERACYMNLAGMVLLGEAEVELIDGVDFVQQPGLLRFHAAYRWIQDMYPSYMLNVVWAHYTPSIDPFTPSQMEQGFLWHGRWVECLDHRGRVIDYGWERNTLSQVGR